MDLVEATNDNPLTSPLGRALCSVSTSAQWSVLDGVVTKVNKSLRGERVVTARELAAFLGEAGDDNLAAHGVWWLSFGAKHMPIVITNPAYARALVASGGKKVCTCGAGPGAGSGGGRYFASHDYNAGRDGIPVGSPATAPTARAGVRQRLGTCIRGGEDTRNKCE